jgi:hypothetical protein
MSLYDPTVENDVDELSLVLVALVTVQRHQNLISHGGVEAYKLASRAGPELADDEWIRTSEESVIFEPCLLPFEHAVIE